MNLFNKSKTIDIIYFCHHTHKHNKLSRESTNLKRLVSSCNEGLNIIGGQYYSSLMAHKIFFILLVAQGLRPIVSGLIYFCSIETSTFFSRNCQSRVP